MRFPGKDDPPDPKTKLYLRYNLNIEHIDLFRHIVYRPQIFGLCKPIIINGSNYGIKWLNYINLLSRGPIETSASMSRTA